MSEYFQIFFFIFSLFIYLPTSFVHREIQHFMYTRSNNFPFHVDKLTALPFCGMLSLLIQYNSIISWTELTFIRSAYGIDENTILCFLYRHFLIV